MEPHADNHRCKEVFAMLSDCLDLELPPDAMLAARTSNQSG
jgi:hypothetical protein